MRHTTVVSLFPLTLVSMALTVLPLAAQGPRSPECSQGLLKKPPIRVLSAHETAIFFPLTMPYGRQVKLSLLENGIELNPGEHATYDILLPDFVADAGVESADLIFSSSSNHLSATMNHSEASPAACGRCTQFHVASGNARTFHAAKVEASAEILIGIAAGDAKEQLTGVLAEGDAGASVQDAVLVVHTKAALGKPIGYTVAERAGFGLPHIEPLLPVDMRDTSIRPGGDGYYYMTGTTGSPDWWTVTGDLHMWKSKDLKQWEPVITQPRVQSTVWNIDRQGTWQKAITMRDGQPFRPLWAPEFHYLKGTYWIPYSIPRLGTGLLKSTSNKAEGPYVSAISPDQPLTPGIDASLFQDDDGAVYFLWGGNNIVRMKDDLSGLAETQRTIGPAQQPFVGFEGISLIKANGKYYLSGADFIFGEYHCFTAVSDKLYGPYSDRYVSVPHGGHNNFFQDQQGRWWSTFFGNDLQAPFREQPGLVPMHLDEKGRLRPDLKPRN